MKNVVLQHKDAFVEGFDRKTSKVYYTKNPVDAKRFSDIGANNFLREVVLADPDFLLPQVRMHIIKRGLPFNPIIVSGDIV